MKQLPPWQVYKEEKAKEENIQQRDFNYPYFVSLLSLVLIGGITLFLIVYFLASKQNTVHNIKNVYSNNSEPVVASTRRLILNNNLNDPVSLAVSQYAFYEMSKTIVSKDLYGFTELLKSGQVFSVPGGTKVLILYNDDAPNLIKVRVLEGEHVGKVGYILPSFIQPA